MDVPLVSIIITAYNYAHMLGTAIESALAQDYPNLEVVVMDNASTDETPALVARYAAADSRIRSFRNAENIGLSPNHNAGLRESRGAYVSFLSADDWLMPKFVSRSFRYLQDHPEIDICYMGAYVADEGGRLAMVRDLSGQPRAAYVGGRNEFAELLGGGCYICFPTMLVKRDIYERFGGLDPAFKGSDYEIVIRWAAAGVRFAYDPEPACVVRMHPQQSTGQINYADTGGMLVELLHIMERHVNEKTEHLLAGSEISILNNLKFFETFSLSSGFTIDAALRKRIERMHERLLDARVSNALQRRKTVLTIGFFAEGELSLIESTLRSLASQEEADFEVLVLYPPGKSPAPLAEYLDRNKRFRLVPLTSTIGEAATLTLALQIAAGSVLTFVRAGNTFDPQFVKRLCEAFDEKEADLVLSPVRVIIEQDVTLASRRTVSSHDDLYPLPSTDALLLGPALPIEGIAFRKRAADAAGQIGEALPVLAYWEYALRLAAAGSVAVQSVPVEVRSYVGKPASALRSPDLVDTIARVHEIYPVPASETRRREDYLAGLRRARASNLMEASDATSICHQLGILAGTRTIPAPANAPL